jgi:cobalamin-dependent methionine synthase I
MNVANNAIDFIVATKRIKERIKEECPYVKISRGISNLSFGFRAVTKIRDSIHVVFLDHARSKNVASTQRIHRQGFVATMMSPTRVYGISLTQ